MKHSHTSRFIALILMPFTLSLSIASAELTVKRPTTADLDIYIQGGGWDFNNNNLPEFLAIQEGVTEISPPEVIYYEVTSAPQLVVLWRFEVDHTGNAQVISARITDLNGNGDPEIAVLINYFSAPAGGTVNWLELFEWNRPGEGFPIDPTGRWDYRGAGISHLRPTGMTVADVDRDNDDELVISTGSPDRMVLIGDWENGKFSARNILKPKLLAGGTSPFSVHRADFNGDLRDDILVVGRGPALTLYSFVGTRKGFQEAPLSIKAPGNVLASSVSTGDLNNDGLEEALIPHGDGSLTLVRLEGTKLVATQLKTQIPGLTHMTMADMDDDGNDEVIYLQQDGSISTNDIQFLAPVPDNYLRSEIEAAVSMPIAYRSFAIYRRPDAGPHFIISTRTEDEALILLSKPTVVRPSATQQPFPDIELPEKDQTLGVTPDMVDDLEKSMEDILIAREEEIAIELEKPPGELPQPSPVEKDLAKMTAPRTSYPEDPRALPPNRTPDVLLYVDDEFTRNVIGDRLEQFEGFRFITNPRGMMFNFQRRAIVWQPKDDQLGAWNAKYEITYRVGVNYEDVITEEGQEFRIVPETQTVKDEILIYVNDKPRITSQPENLRILAGQLFAYKVYVDDKNSDARIEYRVESGPTGMAVDRYGIVQWQTNETNHDDYAAVISISDGFDKDVQSYTVNVNAQLTITSSWTTLARVEKPYTYQLVTFQPGTPKKLSYSLKTPPEGMIIDDQGLISWTPSAAQLDTQTFTIHVTDGMAEAQQQCRLFVNEPPMFAESLPPVSMLPASDTLRFTFTGKDNNTATDLKWELLEGPDGMTVNSTGTLTWPTQPDHTDNYRFAIQLSDGWDVARRRFTVFVNSPIRIVSTPPDFATVGEKLQYRIRVQDVNKNALLKFSRPTIVNDVSKARIYVVDVEDDKYRKDLPKHVARFRDRQTIYVNKPKPPKAGEKAQAARVDLKRYVQDIFIEENQLVIVVTNPETSIFNIDDIIWEVFEGGKGLMPKYKAQIMSYPYFTLLEFPDGMTVSPAGVIQWIPGTSQVDRHRVRFSVSDGFTRDDQAFEIYTNYPPVILSQADTLASVEQRYRYQLRVDDRNEDANISYQLVKGPQGMQIDSKGLVTWIPALEQINDQEYTIEVSDGFASTRQTNYLFVNISPRIISQPRPVALSDFEYTYRVVAEDLNREDVYIKAVKVPKYSNFDARSGLLKWRPRGNQKGPNDVAIEVTDSHGGVTMHEFQVHVFDDPSQRRFLFTSWPLLLAFVGVIFVVGISVGL